MPLPLLLAGAASPLLLSTIGGTPGAGVVATTVASRPLFTTLASLRASDEEPDWVKEIAVGVVLFVVTELGGLGIRALERAFEKDERYFDYGCGMVAVSDVEAFYTENVEESGALKLRRHSSWRVCIRTRTGHSYGVQSFDGDNAEHLAKERVKELSRKFREALVGYGRTS